MNKPIDIFINGRKAFTTTAFRSCHDAIAEIRAVHHLEVDGHYLTVYDYDRLHARYSK